jgi:hypothetical protein
MFTSPSTSIIMVDGAERRSEGGENEKMHATNLLTVKKAVIRAKYMKLELQFWRCSSTSLSHRKSQSSACSHGQAAHDSDGRLGRRRPLIQHSE